MYSENGVMVDFDEITNLVTSADVFTVAFANFPERLIVDTRSNDIETPMVQVVEPARSARDRMNWLHRRRPSLGPPEAFSFFAWPHSPGFMVQSGIWDRIRNRVENGAESQVSVQCDLAIKALLNLDRDATFAVLRGEHCLTLWPRQPEESDGEDEEES
jgi:hypothetical protein